MATIHQITTSTAKRSSSQTSKSTQANTADIILFPGVRYERWAETHARGRSVASRKRDRLEICD